MTGHGIPSPIRPVLILLAFGATGSLAVRASAATVAQPAAHRAGASVTIIGGAPAQRRLARLVALRVGAPSIIRVRFRHPTPALRHEHVHGTEMVVTSKTPQSVRGEWDLDLYAGTFAALAGRYGVALGAIAADERVGPVATWPAFDLYGSRPPTSIQIALLRQRLVQMSARTTAQVVELRVAATPARALALTLRVSDPAAFLEHRALKVLNLLYHPGVPLLGFYVGLQDASGHLVWATSRLPNEGAVFAIPSLDACSPVKHSQLFGGQPPPCPAK